MTLTPPQKTVTHIRISAASGSRRYAAIAGISLALLFGVSLVGSTSILRGQLTDSSLTMHITQSGIDPASVTLTPGATITWRNADVKPHILSSDTLLTTDGLLYSTAIFPEEEFRATIADDSPPGEHSYVSLTDAAIAGTVRIEEQTDLPPEPPPPSPPPPPPPHNPIVADIQSPFPQNITPIDRWSPPLSPPLQKPFRQPETGIPLAIPSLATLAAVLLLTRRILRSPNAQVTRP